HDAISSGWNSQRRVFHVRGFFTEDGAQQSFFRRQFRFGFWRNFADQNVAWFHFRADAHHPVRAQIAQRFFANIWNIARDFFRPELGVARPDLELIDVNGSVDVFLHHLLRDHDGILKIVAIPRHERDQDVASEREFAVIGVRSIGNDLTSLHVLTFFHNWLLVYAGAGIRAH